MGAIRHLLPPPNWPSAIQQDLGRVCTHQADQGENGNVQNSNLQYLVMYNI